MNLAGRADERNRRSLMDLQTMVIGGLVAAVALIVASIVLINKLAN